LTAAEKTEGENVGDCGALLINRTVVLQLTRAAHVKTANQKGEIS